LNVTTYQKSALAILVVGFAMVTLALTGRTTVVTATPVAVTSSSPNLSAGIATFGEATVKVRPDIAILSLGATADSASAADAQGMVAERVAHLLQTAKDLGIADTDVKTYGYDLSPTYQPNDYPKISGYLATEQLSFTLRDVTKVGAALDALGGGAGATNESIQFALEDRSSAEADARTRAVVDARSKAEALAKAGGVKVGQLLSVSDIQQSGYTGPLYDAATPSAAGRAATVVPISDLDVAIRVQVQFAIA
jgi:uncharacterized protein YggE